MAPATSAQGKQISTVVFCILLSSQTSERQFALWPQFSNGGHCFFNLCGFLLLILRMGATIAKLFICQNGNSKLGMLFKFCFAFFMFLSFKTLNCAVTMHCLSNPVISGLLIPTFGLTSISTWNSAPLLSFAWNPIALTIHHRSFFLLIFVSST